MNTLWPTWLPVITLASINRGVSCVEINLVPLHNLDAWFKFLNNIIGAPIFNVNLCGETPLKFKLFKTFGGQSKLGSSKFPEEEQMESKL